MFELRRFNVINDRLATIKPNSLISQNLKISNQNLLFALIEIAQFIFHSLVGSLQNLSNSIFLHRDFKKCLRWILNHNSGFSIEAPRPWDWLFLVLLAYQFHWPIIEHNLSFSKKSLDTNVLQVSIDSCSIDLQSFFRFQLNNCQSFSINVWLKGTPERWNFLWLNSIQFHGTKLGQPNIC